MMASLPGFDRLSPLVSLQEPRKIANGSSPEQQPILPPAATPALETGVPDPPTTILLFCWLNAGPRHILKYSSSYNKLFPNARIVAISCNMPNMIYHSNAMQERWLEPVVEIVQGEPGARILVHLFSNGGNHEFANFSTAFHKRTGGLPPIRAMVLDSTPGQGTIKSGVGVILAQTKPGLIRIMTIVTAIVVMLLVSIVNAILGIENAITRARWRLNDPGWTRLEVPRCYIYSEMDRLVDWKDVEAHSAEAEARGWHVTREKFTGSPHVSHARLDEMRYWTIVKALWKSTSDNSLRSEFQKIAVRA